MVPSSRKKTECLIPEQVRGLLPLCHKAKAKVSSNNTAKEPSIKKMQLGIVDPIL